MSHERSPDKLIHMANQIGRFFASQGGDEAVAGTALHIQKFWDPRMRAAILAYLEETGGSGLDPHVREAVLQIRAWAKNEIKAASGMS